MSNVCINMDLFTAYFGQYISNEDRKEVEKHISSCNKCLSLFVMTAKTLLDPDIYEYEITSKNKAKEIWISIKRALDRFVKWGSTQFPPQWALNPSSSLQPVPVIVRSDEESEHPSDPIKERDSHTLNSSPVDYAYVSKEFNHLFSEIYFEHVDENKITLKVKVTTENQDIDDMLIFVENNLTGPTAKPLIDEFVVFEDLPYGSYRIKLEQDDNEIGEHKIKITENGIYLL